MHCTVNWLLFHFLFKVDEIVQVAVLGLPREVPVQQSELPVAVEDGVGVAEPAPRPRVAVLDAEIGQDLLGGWGQLWKWVGFFSYLSTYQRLELFDCFAFSH